MRRILAGASVVTLFLLVFMFVAMHLNAVDYVSR